MRNPTRNPILFALLSLTLAVSSLGVLPAADWATWRGPNSDGFSPETNLPDTWGAEGRNVRWKAPIGSRSTPIVLDGRVCVITLAEPETPERWQERIVCLDETSGAIRFDFRYNVFQTDIPHHRVGWASLAGDADTGIIYALGVAGMLSALDAEGKLLWKRNFEEEVGRISGFGGRTVTPIIDGDLVIVSFLSAGWGSTFIPRHRYYALNKATGETVWISTPGGAPEDTTYSVPVVRVINGQRLLIDGNGDGGVYALKVGTGEKVWAFDLSKRGLNSSVVVDGNLVYASHSEENADESTAMGRLVCLDASQITDGKPREVWRAEAFTGGYASPVIHDGILYHVDNSANLVAFDAKTGKRLWRHNLGIAQRASPVVADGKVFVSDVDGKFHILRLNGANPPEALDVEEFKNPDGSAVQINGSPAIANGQIILPTNNELYAIASQPSMAQAAPSALPPVERAPAGAKPAYLQVLPAEVVLKPGATQTLTARTFDEMGRLIGETEAEWSLDGLKATISPAGVLAVSPDQVFQGGLVVATAGGLKGSARVSSRPVIPFQQDFESVEETRVPNGWNAAQGRFEVVTVEGNKILKKSGDNPRSWRTTVYIGDPAASNYVIEADVMGMESRRRMPDIGLVSHRYTLALMGNQQRLQIRTWLSELERFSETIPFRWDPGVWYHLKMDVDVAADGGTATVRGKVWKRGEAEPAEWTIEAEDQLPHREGAPGIYGFSVADTFYDNVAVTPKGD